MKVGALTAASFALALLAPARARAGPPYVTDDPEPVAHRHWEISFASQVFHDRSGWSGSLEQIDLNWGALPSLQLHVLPSLAFAATNGGATVVGYGDTEIGFKLRFLEERRHSPMLAIYPLLEVPTGDRAAGLGGGTAVAFLPVWIQQDFGAWTTYGGAGAWIDLARPSRHWWRFGWYVGRRLTKFLSAGAEIVDDTSSGPDAPNDARFNVGAILDVDATQHLLVSAGRGFVGPNLFQAYVAWTLTFAGPSAEAPTGSHRPGEITGSGDPLEGPRFAW